MPVKRSLVALIAMTWLAVHIFCGEDMVAPNGRATRFGGVVAKRRSRHSVVIVSRDATVYSHSTGLADIAAKTPMSFSHTLSAFSMTKTLTAIAILQLAERRKLGIDDRVSKYRGILTIRNHDQTSSRSHRRDSEPHPDEVGSPCKDHGGFDETPALARVLAEHPKRDGNPGEKYGYSNIGYWLLGRVVESVSNRATPIT